MAKAKKKTSKKTKKADFVRIAILGGDIYEDKSLVGKTIEQVRKGADKKLKRLFAVMKCMLGAKPVSHDTVLKAGDTLIFVSEVFGEGTTRVFCDELPTIEKVQKLLDEYLLANGHWKVEGNDGNNLCVDLKANNKMGQPREFFVTLDVDATMIKISAGAGDKFTRVVAKGFAELCERDFGEHDDEEGIDDDEHC